MSHFTDPYTASETTYECYDCSGRVVVDGHQGACPDCGGNVRNISVPRE
ncbi:rubrerythrin-like domain-containing protein [Haloglomus litoreum]|nr:rubrerythrin-like domain-containing protein [Haloglomus sp. DT116]